MADAAKHDQQHQQGGTDDRGVHACQQAIGSQNEGTDHKAGFGGAPTQQQRKKPCQNPYMKAADGK